MHSPDFDTERAAKLWAGCHDLRLPKTSHECDSITRHLGLVESGAPDAQIETSRELLRMLLAKSVDQDADSSATSVNEQRELVQSV